MGSHHGRLALYMVAPPPGPKGTNREHYFFL
jgi:hypothetical protein